MSTVLFGQALGRFVHISSHDVNEILEEQSGSRHRFGDIALAWGLCSPEHIWQAWSEQLTSGGSAVELEKVGVDTQAASLLPTEVAHRLRVIPIRCFGNTVVVATSDLEPAHLAAELRAITAMEPRFVHTDAAQIQRSLGIYYPATPAAA